MTLAPAIVLILAYFGLARCVGNNPAADLFVDHLLAAAYPAELEDRGLDPAPLDPFRTDFEAERPLLAGSIFKGSFFFSAGRLTGLARARRDSACDDTSTNAPKKGNATAVAVRCSLAWDELRVRYEGRIRRGKLPRARVDGRCALRGVRAEVEIVRSGLLLLPTTRRFAVASAGVARARLGGVAALGLRFARAQEEVFQGHVQAKVFNLMYDRLQYALQRAIGKVSAPAI